MSGLISPVLEQSGFLINYRIKIPAGQFVWREQFTWG